MPKTFLEYLGGFRIGNLDAFQPIASLGDLPPKGQGGRDSRALGLNASDKNPNDKDSKEIQKKQNKKNEELTSFKKRVLQKISKPIKDYNKKKEKKEDDMSIGGSVGPGMQTYEPTADLSTARKKIKEDLYSDDNPNDTVKGTGYGDAETARKTLNIIKSVDKQRQMQIVNTLYNRAKHHANQTADMRAAMSIFKSWIDNKKIKESVLYKHMIDKKIIKD